MTAPLTSRRGGLVRVAAAGVLAGFLSGLLGVGGGILIVPALVLLVHLPQRLAHGTSLAAIVPIAVTGLAGYALDGQVDWTVAAFLAVGSVVGALVGTHLLHVTSARALAVVFAAVMVLTALRLVLGPADAPGRGALTVGLALALVALGVLAGVLAGLLGVGGGVVLIAAMVVLLGMPATLAKGTSLAVIVPTALVGTARNVRRGNADLRIAAVVGVAGMAAAFAGSRVAVGLDDRVSNVLFAVLLLVMAARMLQEEWRRPPGEVLEPGEA